MPRVLQIPGRIGPFSVGGTCPTLLNNISEYWDLNESAGSSRVGEANSITLTESGGNVTTFSPGHVSGLAVITKEAGTPFLRVADSPTINFGGSDFEVGFWFFVVGPTWPALNRAVVGKLSPGSVQGQWDVFIQGTSVGAESIGFNIWNAAGTSPAVTLITAVPQLVNNWMFVQCSFDNGVSIRTRISTTTGFGALQSNATAVTVPSNTGDLHIGRDGGGVTVTDVYVEGLGMWPRLLTAAEEQCWWNTGLGLDHPF